MLKITKSKRINITSIIRYMMLLMLLIDIAFVISLTALSYFHIYFRQIIVDFIYINTASLILLLAVDFNIKIVKKQESISAKLIVSLISGISSLFIIGFILFYILFIYAFTANQERLCYLEGEKLLAVSSSSFHDSFVTFYKPLNFAFKKDYEHESFSFNSPSNCYDYSYIIDLDSEDIDLSYDYYLRGFPTLAAKEKFFNGTFEYLGEHTYDFNDITIKFDKKETN